MQSPSSSPSHHSDENVFDFGVLFERIYKGLSQSLGFAILGVFLGIVYALTLGSIKEIKTTSRVVFAFDGIEKGEYPDGSGFNPDDLRSPDIINEALNSIGLDSSPALQASIRSALTIEGVISPRVIRERDRLRASGQTLEPLIPDEYQVSLSLPRRFVLDQSQRERFLSELIGAYRGKFERTYANVPLNIGNAFASLDGADYFEYELILNSEINKISEYLKQQLLADKKFRSSSTNLTFSDLFEKVEVFKRLRINEILGFIRQYGLSKDRTMALIKIDYYLRTLEDQEELAMKENSVVQELLDYSSQKGSEYVLGIKNQAAPGSGSASLVDKGLIDSLIENDSHGFLIREALEAGLRLKAIQSEKEVIKERRKVMEGFANEESPNQTAILERLAVSISKLKADYNTLVEELRLTHDNFAEQHFANAIRISMQAVTDSFIRATIIAAVSGLMLGGTFGIGLSLLNVFVDRRRKSA